MTCDHQHDGKSACDNNLPRHKRYALGDSNRTVVLTHSDGCTDKMTETQFACLAKGHDWKMSDPTSLEVCGRVGCTAERTNPRAMPVQKTPMSPERVEEALDFIAENFKGKSKPSNDQAGGKTE